MPAQVGSITGGVHAPAIRNGADLPGNQSPGGPVTIERQLRNVRAEGRAGLAAFFWLQKHASRYLLDRAKARTMLNYNDDFTVEYSLAERPVLQVLRQSDLMAN